MPPGKKWPTLLGAHDDVDANRIAASHRRLHAIQRRGHGSNFAACSRRDLRFRFFAHRKRGRQLRVCAGRSGFSSRAARERAQKYPPQMPALQKVFRHLQLLRRLHSPSATRCWRPGKRCECTLPLTLPISFEALQRHVAIGALLRLRRIVKRPRALSRNAAGLPVVVLVEAANPAIVIHRHIEMHLVARRAELRRLVAHERLEKHAPVRLRDSASTRKSCR